MINSKMYYKIPLSFSIMENRKQIIFSNSIFELTILIGVNH